MDDAFQRTHFTRFTSPEAAPRADPDGDGAINQEEAFAGTVPTDRASVLRIERILREDGAARVLWQSVRGKRYRVLARAALATGGWRPIGAPLIADGPLTELVETAASSATQFYRVEVLP